MTIGRLVPLWKIEAWDEAKTRITKLLTGYHVGHEVGYGSSLIGAPVLEE